MVPQYFLQNAHKPDNITVKSDPQPICNARAPRNDSTRYGVFEELSELFPSLPLFPSPQVNTSVSPSKFPVEIKIMNKFFQTSLISKKHTCYTSYMCCSCTYTYYFFLCKKRHTNRR